MTLVVEWRHLDVQGQTCDRCRDTGAELRDAIKALSAEFAGDGVRIEYRETRLAPSTSPRPTAFSWTGCP
ncbi:MOSC containing domain protein, partial [Desulfovibrio sp. A2]